MNQAQKRVAYTATRILTHTHTQSQFHIHTQPEITRRLDELIVIYTQHTLGVKNVLCTRCIMNIAYYIRHAMWRLACFSIKLH